MSHCDDDLLKRFAGGQLTDDEHARCEGHLADCASCRRALIDSRFGGVDSVRSVPPELVANAVRKGVKSRPRFSTRVWLAAAAAILLVVIGLAIRPAPEPESASKDALRVGEPLEASLALVSPIDEATVRASDFELTWTEVPDARAYTVRILNERGDVVLERSSDSPRLQIRDIPAAGLGSGYWYVSATTASGEVIESPIRAIVIEK